MLALPGHTLAFSPRILCKMLVEAALLSIREILAPKFQLGWLMGCLPVLSTQEQDGHMYISVSASMIWVRITDVAELDQKRIQSKPTSLS